MMNRNTYSITLLVISVFLSVWAGAQNKTTVKATVDRSSILIGEPIRLTLEADIPQNQPIRFFQLDTIPHFELLDKQPIDTSDTESGTFLSQVIRITSFDSGHWVIPQLTLYGDITTDSIPIDVGFAPFDSSKPYNDIKDIIEVKPAEEKKKQQWWYYAVGAALLILLLVLLLTRKKKKPEIIVPAVQPDPYKAAMADLEKLQKEKGDAKYYYSALVDIFRVYVHDKKGIHSLQKTTDDLVVQLKELKMPKEQFDRLSQSLRLSDFVKFAKYEPSKEDDRAAFDTIKASIDHIEQMQ
jgi:LPXTG-motif cell wall-anchored protein